MSVLCDRHPNPDVRKLSKRMLFGFQAMDNLKTHTISYGVGDAYRDYFRKVVSDYDSTYFAEDSDADNISTIFFLVALIFLPMATVFFLAQR